MLERLITWSLRHRLLVCAIWLVLSIVGLFSFWSLPLDAFPDTTPVQVQVNTTAPALSPLEVERQITFPVESVISGMPDLKEVRSISKFGLSQVTVIFEDGTDIWRSRQMVMERLGAVELPPGIESPQLGPVATGLGEVFHYLLTAEDKSLAEVRTLHDWVVAPQMRSVEGVAEVNTWGGDERQVQVVVDPRALQQYGLTLDALVSALEENNANVSGGTLERGGEAALVRGVGLLTKPEDIAAIVITAHNGVPVTVGNVAKVVEGREIRRGAVTAEGKGEVVLGLGFMLMGENSHDVTHRLKLRLAEVQKSLPEGVTIETVYDRTELVERVLRTVETNLYEGALLVIAVLFVFLGNLRAGLVVALAIPLSMLFSFSVMLQAGIAGSLMSLGAIDFGLIVDSSIIQVENAVRRMGESGGRRSRIDVVREAAIEVRKPTLFGEMIIMIVYLPILALTGIEGKLFRPMALTVIFALLGSMALSMTLVPVLTSFVLPKQISEREGRLMGGLQRGYHRLLQWALGHRGLVLGLVVLALANAAFLATRLGSEFVPRLREGALVLNTVRLASVSLDESVRYGTQVEKTLREKFPDEIAHIWTRTGSAEVATDPMGVELSDVFITLTERDQWKKAETQDELVEAMEAELSVLPGMRMGFTQPIEMRVNEMVAGVRTDIGVKIFGEDLDVLKRKAREIDGVLKAIPGAADVTTEQVTGAPLVDVVVDREAIARYGIPAGEVLEAVAALGGREVGELQEGERRFPIAVRLAEDYRLDATALGTILVSTANGEQIPLSRLARIERSEGPSTINREWGKRRVVVQANVRDRDVGSYVAEARAAIDQQVELPPGYYVRFGGQFENYEAARKRLMLVVPIALASIFALLYVSFGQFWDAVRVFTGVPFAAVGGVFALWLRDLPFSISAGVGFVALSGVAVLGEMVLVSTIRQHLSEGMELRTAVEEAARRRLRPVLMTALVASLGFVPMALNTGIGAEVQRPLATVVIGGVISSTLLTLLVLPVLYVVLGKRDSEGDSSPVPPIIRRVGSVE